MSPRNTEHSNVENVPSLEEKVAQATSGGAT